MNYTNNYMKVIKKKSLGQNFLKDEDVLDKIIEAGELSFIGSVLEIGPGEGALTKKLLKNVGKIVAIEKDERMRDENSALQKINKNNDNLKLEFGDILEVDLSEILERNSFQKYKVIANIPYYITGKIIRLLFEQKQRPELIVLLVQKEVADRIVAKEGKQSILSLAVQYYAKVEIVDYVSREAFEPIPKVDSAILKIVPFKNKKHNKTKEEKFFRLVKIGFSSPRKVLINNLKNGLKIEKEKLKEVFDKVSLSLNIRAEKLTIKDWERLDKNLVL